MKASGKGLELEVGLTPEEILVLFFGKIDGVAKIYDYQDNLHEVPITLSTKVEDRMRGHFGTAMVYVETDPLNCYLTEAKRVSFYLGEEMKQQLTKRRFTVDRFSTGGKIKIFDSTRPDAYC